MDTTNRQRLICLQATAETVDLGPPHEPKHESIKAFKEIECELKKELVHLRHQHNSLSTAAAPNRFPEPSPPSSSFTRSSHTAD